MEYMARRKHAAAAQCIAQVRRLLELQNSRDEYVDSNPDRYDDGRYNPAIHGNSVTDSIVGSLQRGRDSALVVVILVLVQETSDLTS